MLLPGDLVLVDTGCYCRKVGSHEEDWFYCGTMGLIVWTSPHLTETDDSAAVIYGVLFGNRGMWYVEDRRLVKADDVGPSVVDRVKFWRDAESYDKILKNL